MALLLLVLFVAAAAVAWLSTSQVKRLAEHIGCIDHPDERKLHSLATPRLGGVAIIIGFALPLLFVPLSAHAAALVTKNLSYLFAVMGGGSLIIALGVYDDLFGSNAPKKFTVQIIAALVLVAFGFRFEAIALPWVGDVRLGIFGAIVTVVWVVGVINAVNFIDGMDGLATIVTFTTAISVGVIAAIRGDVVSIVIMTALSGSLLGFLPWNRSPAKIFMGDSGSLFIGFLLAACSVARYSKAPTAIIVGGPVLALALPVIDTLIVMTGRFQGERSLGRRFLRMFNADRSHIHHVLIAKYGSHRKVLGWIWGMTVLFGIAAVTTILPEWKAWGYLLAAATLILLVVVRSRSRARIEQPDDGSSEIVAGRV